MRLFQRFLCSFTLPTGERRPARFRLPLLAAVGGHCPLGVEIDLDVRLLLRGQVENAYWIVMQTLNEFLQGTLLYSCLLLTQSTSIVRRR